MAKKKKKAKKKVAKKPTKKKATKKKAKKRKKKQCNSLAAMNCGMLCDNGRPCNEYKAFHFFYIRNEA